MLLGCTAVHHAATFYTARDGFESSPVAVASVGASKQKGKRENNSVWLPTTLRQIRERHGRDKADIRGGGSSGTLRTSPRLPGDKYPVLCSRLAEGIGSTGKIATVCRS